MWLLRLPGVYRPQADTRLLLSALRDAGLGRSARALDLCTGSGVAAIAAARGGARQVTAVDRYLPAVFSARFNARVRGLPVRVLHGGLTAVHGQFDLITANPPYVPSPSVEPAQGAAMAWDAGLDGRRCLDELCERAADLLAPDGTMLIVHSALCGIEATLESLRDKGLKSSVVARATEPFGPVMRSRIEYLEDAGLIEPGERTEELVVIRADRIER
ncbi:methyltransferase [Amycolatopsis acidiphila]|uniref:Methyltransferase n=1 Tax=Amycolatopsis acidiphila TaxID=715473 RepID=A0A558A7J1_9PSEU|nr:HemK2/MTQ2 family protein methyltransferase [Amycolatopsis acidiphila]TVT20208.1 methyltransferase [Amycolatopsis acidiphila]UIJ58243.1 methyltransferase [Amycolatopsis acidiphila]GHG69217.1 methyltransferase [Amycolatopsis acidiphila]